MSVSVKSVYNTCCVSGKYVCVRVLLSAFGILWKKGCFIAGTSANRESARKVNGPAFNNW